MSYHCRLSASCGTSAIDQNRNVHLKMLGIYIPHSICIFSTVQHVYTLRQDANGCLSGCPTATHCQARLSAHHCVVSRLRGKNYSWDGVGWWLLGTPRGGHLTYSSATHYRTARGTEGRLGDSLSRTQLLRAIHGGMLQFPPGEWAHVTEAAKDCVRMLLTVEAADRPTVSSSLPLPRICGCLAA